MRRTKDQDFVPYRILAFSMILGAILMIGLGLLLYIPGKGIRLLKYSYTVEQAKMALMVLFIASVPMILFGLVTLIFKLKKLPIAYIALIYMTLCCGVICVISQYAFILAYILPTLAAQLFFDKKLTGWCEASSVIVFFLSVFVSAFVLKIYPVNTGNNQAFYRSIIKLVAPNFAILIVFIILFNVLSNHTSILKNSNNEHIRSLDSHASGMETLITSSLNLFTTTNLKELNRNLVDICKDVCTPFLENPADEIKVLIGYSDKGNYICKDELGNDVRVVKTAETLDIVYSDKELGVPHTVIYDSPFTKSSGFASYIELNDDVNKNLFEAQVEKEKEFEKAKTIKNEFTYTFEKSKDATIMRIYSRDYKAEQKEKDRLEAEARGRINKNQANSYDSTDVTQSISPMIEPPVILKLIYYVIIDAKLNVNTTLDEFINILTNNVGAALINLNLNLEFIASQREMIYSFSVVTDSRSHHTANHVKRVSEYMKVLCSDPKWGFTEKKVERISIAAMMHDVGKIYIPLEILDKKSGLTDEEFNIIKSHVTRGAELIEKCPGDIMRYAKVMIRDHHERWDGKGYLKKKETQIDLLGRIIAVADVFDALMSPRPYKESWPKDRVRDTIIHDRGHFDPQVITVFTNHFDELCQIYYDNKDEEIK